MFILTQASRLQNNKDNIYRVCNAELEKQYLDAGYQRYERNYKIKEQHKEYTVICPEFRNDAKNAEPIVIIPEFLVPRRPYPVYVYLYAIDLYSVDPEKGQRMAAKETRKYFGLTTFAHTTLGRALKTFVRVISGDAITPKETVQKTATDGEAKPSRFPTVQTTEVFRKQAADFLHGTLVRTGLQQAVADDCKLAGKWFMKYGHFLL